MRFPKIGGSSPVPANQPPFLVEPGERNSSVPQGLKITKFRHKRYFNWSQAGGNGFEPLLTDPESVVLPLDEPPVRTALC